MAAQNVSNVLVIHLGSTNSRSFLFNLVNEEVKLVCSHEMLTVDDKDLVVASLKSHHKEQFEEIILIDNDRSEQEAFLAAVKLASSDGDVMVIDVGSKKTLIGQGSFGRLKFKSYDFGVGEKALEVLKHGPPKADEAIASFLSSSWKLTDIENHIGQISLYPGIVPATPDYLELTQAVARSVLVAAKEKPLGFFSSTRRVGPARHASPGEAGGELAAAKVILTGAVFGKAPKLGQALLTFLDGIEQEGAFQVFVDKNLTFTALGALSSRIYDLRFTNDQFKTLGSVLVLSHKHLDDTIIASLKLDLGLDEKLEVEIKAGEILRVPYNKGTEGQVELGLRSGVEIAGGQQKLQVEGGVLGLVIDARGRPLPRLPINEEGCQKLKKWREALEC